MIIDELNKAGIEYDDITIVVSTGILQINPVSDDMFEITEEIDPDFMINVVVNEKKSI